VTLRAETLVETPAERRPLTFVAVFKR